MKIGIYGGSFNPIHKGHLKVASESIKHLDLDKLIFVPTFKSPFKTKIKEVNASHRFKMIELVLKENMEVSDFEIKRGGKSYTIDTVKYFSNQYKNDQLFLIIGSDSLKKLHKWNEISHISKLTTISIFKRGIYSKENIKKFNCKLINNELYDFSSTEYRKGNLKNVDDKVQSYIAKKFLYANDILISLTDIKRYKHCVSTGHLAAEYAKTLGYDAKIAWFAGFMHDITKNKSKEWSQNYLIKCGENINDIPIHKYHSLTAYYWLKNEYKLENKEILNAIRIHTSLEFELSILDKIVYAADKLCDGRKLEGIQNIRKLMFKDFNKGFREIVKLTIENLKKEEKYFDDKQNEIYERWSNKNPQSYN